MEYYKIIYITFGDFEIKKKKRFLLIKKHKYFIGCLCDDYKIKSLHIMLPKTSVCGKSYDCQTKLIYFPNDDDNLWEKFNIIWEKVIADIKKEFDIELVYNEKILKTKIKSYSAEATDFSDKETLRWTLIILV